MLHWLPKKYYPIFQRNKEGEPWDESCPTIAELHERDNKKKLHKEFRRIRL